MSFSTQTKPSSIGLGPIVLPSRQTSVGGVQSWFERKGELRHRAFTHPVGSVPLFIMKGGVKVVDLQGRFCGSIPEVGPRPFWVPIVVVLMSDVPKNGTTLS